LLNFSIKFANSKQTKKRLRSKNSFAENTMLRVITVIKKPTMKKLSSFSFSVLYLEKSFTS